MVLGKVAVVLGSGIAGSVLASDAKLPSLGDLLSGASKFAKKHGKEGGAAKSSSDHAQIQSQVDSIRADLQHFASRPVTVITNTAKSGPGVYTITIVVVAGLIGYAYIKWKGWKLSDLMFVTKRGLSDACNVVGSQLDQVSQTVGVTRRHLSGRIDRVDITLDETQHIIEGTRDEVAIIHGDLSAFQEDLQSVNLVVRTLESKMGRLECSQDQTIDGIRNLCEFTRKMETIQNGNVGQMPSPPIVASIGSSSEHIVRATCLPRPAPRLSLEASSPVAAESPLAESSSQVSTADEPRSQVQGHKGGFVNRTTMSTTSREGSSHGIYPSAEAGGVNTAPITNPTRSKSRFGGLGLPGLGFLSAAASTLS